MNAAPHEVRRQLTRTELGADHLQAGFSLGLEGLFRQERQCLVIGHLRAVHLVIENRVRNAPQEELQLHQSQRQVTGPVAFIEHHLLTVVRPAFGIDSGPQHSTQQRRVPVRIGQLDIMPG